jgi:hypothetical protein
MRKAYEEVTRWHKTRLTINGRNDIAQKRMLRSRIRFFITMEFQATYHEELTLLFLG